MVSKTNVVVGFLPTWLLTNRQDVMRPSFSQENASLLINKTIYVPSTEFPNLKQIPTLLPGIITDYNHAKSQWTYKVKKFGEVSFECTDYNKLSKWSDKKAMAQELAHYALKLFSFVLPDQVFFLHSIPSPFFFSVGRRRARRFGRRRDW